MGGNGARLRGRRRARLGLRATPRARGAALRTLVIVNPLSGGGRRPRQAEGELARLGLAGRLVRLSSLGAIEGAARRAAAEGLGRLIVCGGDGSLNAALNGLAGSECALGIVPCGLGNDIARGLGLPLSIEEACRLLPRLRPRPLDLIRVGGGRYFASVGAVGVPAHVTAFVRRRKGSGAPWWALYAAALARGIFAAEAARIEVASDGFSFRGLALAAVFANGPVVGRWFRVAPRARMDDGLMEVGVLAAAGRGRLLAVGAASILSRHQGLAGMVAGRARRLSLRAEPPLELWADGELMGRTPLGLEVVRGAVRVVGDPLVEKV